VTETTGFRQELPSALRSSRNNACPARAQAMHGARPDFLTGTSFAGDKNGTTDIGCPFDMARNAADLGIPQDQLSGSSGASASKDSIEGATLVCVIGSLFRH